MTAVRVSFLTIVCLLVASGCVQSQPDSPQPEPQTVDVRDAKTWFDGLGYDLLRPFVRVATGGWSRSGNDPAEKEFRCGFLQSTDETEFRVLFSDLEESKFSCSPTDTEEHERVYYEAADLKAFAKASLANANDSESDKWSYYDEHVSVRSEFFVIARACELAGHQETAAQLYAYINSEVGSDDKDICSAIKNDLAHSQFSSLRLGLRDLD
ncbi:MAG: hypothetical protein V3V10_09010, partial [Planctomycetota bacterium]